MFFFVPPISFGCVNAVSAADMALAGIEPRPPVRVVVAIIGVGGRLPLVFLRTGLWGVGGTPPPAALSAPKCGAVSSDI